MPSKAIILSSLRHCSHVDVKLFTICMTDLLSQKITILVLHSSGRLPHTINATVRAYNSKNSILGWHVSMKPGFHHLAIQKLLYVAPIPKVTTLDASEKKGIMVEYAYRPWESTKGQHNLWFWSPTLLIAKFYRHDSPSQIHDLKWHDGAIMSIQIVNLWWTVWAAGLSYPGESVEHTFPW